MVRPVVDSCSLNEFAGGGLEYLAGGTTRWKRLPTSAGGAHRSFVELTTKSDNPRWPDRPGRAGTNDQKELQSPRSSFGVMRAVLHDSPTAPFPELTPVLALFEPTALAAGTFDTTSNPKTPEASAYRFGVSEVVPRRIVCPTRPIGASAGEAITTVPLLRFSYRKKR